MAATPGRRPGRGLAARPAADAPPPRAFASLVQALAHGLSVQLAADPDAFDRQEMLDLCLALFATYRGRPASANGRPKARKGHRA